MQEKVTVEKQRVFAENTNSTIALFISHMEGDREYP